MIEFKLPDMTCGHCASKVGMALQAAAPGCKLDIDLAQHKVTVETGEERAVLVDALVEAGYPPA